MCHPHSTNYRFRALQNYCALPKKIYNPAERMYSILTFLRFQSCKRLLFLYRTKFYALRLKCTWTPSLKCKRLHIVGNTTLRFTETEIPHVKSTEKHSETYHWRLSTAWRQSCRQKLRRLIIWYKLKDGTVEPPIRVLTHFIQCSSI